MLLMVVVMIVRACACEPRVYMAGMFQSSLVLSTKKLRSQYPARCGPRKNPVLKIRSGPVLVQTGPVRSGSCFFVFVFVFFDLFQGPLFRHCFLVFTFLGSSLSTLFFRLFLRAHFLEIVFFSAFFEGLQALEGISFFSREISCRMHS